MFDSVINGSRQVAHTLATSLLRAGVRRWYSFGPGLERSPLDNAPAQTVTQHLVGGRPGQLAPFAELPTLLARGFVHALVNLGMPVDQELTLRAQLTAKVPVVGFVHAVPDDGQLLMRQLAAPSYPCDVLFCPSESGRRVLAAHDTAFREVLGRAPFCGSVEVIPYGVMPPPPLRRAVVRKQLGWRDEDIVILAFARLSKTFKYDATPMLLAFAEAQRRAPTLRLVLGGAADPGYAEQLEAVASELGLASRIEIHPDVAAAERDALYAAADVYLAYSDSVQETHGIALVEAMACGLPVVAAAFDGFKEIAEGAGILLPTTFAAADAEVSALAGLRFGDRRSPYQAEHVTIDLAATVAALVSLAQEPERRASMSAASLARVHARYDADKNAVLVAARMQRAVSEARTMTWPVLRPNLGVNWQALFGHYASAPLHHVTQGPWPLERLSPEVLIELGVATRTKVKRLIADAHVLAATPIALDALTAQLAPRHPSLNAAAIRRWLIKACKYGVLASA